jgi:hypothetical protein
MQLHQVLEIRPMTRRIWFTHPMYWRARRNLWNCWRWYRPWLNWCVGYRYFIDGVEVDIYGNEEQA